jgi:hypothetical protein
MYGMGVRPYNIYTVSSGACSIVRLDLRWKYAGYE